MTGQSKLAIVIPAFNEGNIIEPFILRVKEVVDRLEQKNVICVIDDGSTDQTWEIVQGLGKRLGSQFLALRFSRNFGKDAAIVAGLSAVNSDCYIVMDADGQHPPELINIFYQRWLENNLDIIDGIKKITDIHIASKIFNYIFRKVTGLDLTNASDFKLISHRVRDALLKCGDQAFFFRGLTAWVGFKRDSVLFAVQKRKTGRSKWSNTKIFLYALNAFLLNSFMPLYFLLFIGLLLLIISGILLIKVLISYFFGEVYMGYSTLIVFPLIGFSAIFFSIAILGLYLSKILEQSKERPRYIIMDHISPDKE